MSERNVVIVHRKLDDTTGWVVSCVKELPNLEFTSNETIAQNIMGMEKDRVLKLHPQFKMALWGYQIMPLE